MSRSMCAAVAVLMASAFIGAAEAKVQVVATVPDLGALAREVGGQDVEVRVLARSTQDPHFVDGRLNLVLDVSRAQLLVFNGLELEAGWLPVLITNARNPAVQPGSPGHLDASTLVTPRDVPQGRVDRSMGDIHSGGNPHYTLDPRNGVKVARGIAERLAQLEPEKAEAFRARAAAFEEAMGTRIAAWQERLAPFEGAPVVTYHRSWGYFIAFAGLREVAHVEPKPGLPPSAGHVAQVLARMKREQVKLILQEDWYQAATSDQLAKLSGATVVRVPGQTREGQRYPDHIGAIVEQTARALEKGR
jgi:zinc/manganese transport system substrate-binding protein